MPIRVACRSCGRQLNAPDNLAGRKAKCPNCRTVLPIPAAEPVDAAPPVPKERKLPRRRQPEPEERITREPEAGEEPDPGEVLQVVTTTKKSVRKKRRPPPKRSESEFPAWASWLIVDAVLILLAGSVALGAAFQGHATEVLVYSVILAVMVPISTVILIISMFISSALGGGIEFGDARIVIPKAFGLLFLVNLISLLPLGSFLALPVWLAGLMFLFGLELWETRVLFLVNWGLNYLVQMAILGAIRAAMAH